MTGKRNIEAFSPEDMARRRKRSIAMAILLCALMVIFFFSTIVRLGGNLAERAL